MQDQKQHPMRLSIRLEGPKVSEARMSAYDLAEIVRRTQSSIKQIGQLLSNKSSNARGRKKKEVEQFCEIFLVAWDKGSAIARFELAPSPRQKSWIGEIGEASIDAFIAGMRGIASGVDRTGLPEGFNQGVMQTIDGMGVVLDHGVEQMTFFIEDLESPGEAIYNPQFRARVRSLMESPEQKGVETKTGRLEMLNGHGGLSGRLFAPDGSKWNCRFQKEHLEMLAGAWMRNVKITGNLTATDKEGSIEVANLSILDEEVLEFDETAANSFWESASIEELAEQQGVSPVSDLDRISELWPAADDADELFEFIIAERGKRRDLPMNAAVEK